MGTKFLPKKDYSPQFSAHVYGQTAGWIKIPRSTKVGLGSGHIVLELPKRGATPNCWLVCCGQTAGWIKMPLRTKVGLGPGRIGLDGDPAPLRKGAQLPNFRPMSIVAKRSPISATAEHFLHSSWQIVSILYKQFCSS